MQDKITTSQKILLSRFLQQTEMRTPNEIIEFTSYSCRYVTITTAHMQIFRKVPAFEFLLAISLIAILLKRFYVFQVLAAINILLY
jgi:hypothetical protein